MTSPVIERGMVAHLRGRNRFLNVMTHDVVERLRIRRKALAADAGLDESYDVGTYPPEPSSVTVENGGWLKGLVAGGLMSMAGAGALGLGLSLAGVNLPGGKPDTSPPASAVDPMEFDIVIESVDGEVKADVD